MSEDLELKIIKTRIKLLRKSPFFGTLLLNAKHVVTEDVPTAATDGEVLFLNKEFMLGLTADHFQSVLLHEVLHMALEHVGRMKAPFKENPMLANYAADIVVNGIIEDNGFSLPKDAVRDDKLKHLSVLEVYQILKREQQEDSASGGAGSKKGNGKGNGKGSSRPGLESANSCLRPDLAEGGGKEDQDNNSASSKKAGTLWKDVLNKASVIAKSKKAGVTGAGLSRVFDELLQPTISWKDLLYKYVTETRTDFESFDRRFIHSGQYIDDLGGGKIHVMAFVDTSGSVDYKLLSEFIAELRGAVNALPQIEGELWYFDAQLYPQGDIKELLSAPKITAQGGGGTSFHPAMKLVSEDEHLDQTVRTVAIMFTDGYASYTNLPGSDSSVLWCISPGGVESEAIPFGEVVRMLN